MPSEVNRIYWDACVFLSYINEYAERLSVIDALLARSESNDDPTEIVTSTVSIVEVAFALSEKASSSLNEEVETKIDQLWSDRSAVKLVEFHEGIAIEARGLMRTALTQDWSLKPADAIHLATAKHLAVTEFHTYSRDLVKYKAMTGYSICEPYTPQGSLFG